MSSLPNASCHRLPCRRVFHHLLCRRIPRVSSLPLNNSNNNNNNNNKASCRAPNHIRLHSQLHAVPTADDAYNKSAQELHSSSAADGGLTEGNANQTAGSLSSVKILDQLKRYGVSGILSYGILNTAYYSTTFLLVWFYFSPAPGKMGYIAAVGRFLKVMAMVWAGSQVTKLIRAAGALALAPFVDQGLLWFTERFKFESRGKAFLVIVGFCLGLALILFFTVTLLAA